MGFIKEVSTEEDEEKYQLNKVVKARSIRTQSRHALCIDRSKNIVFFRIYLGSPRTGDVGVHDFALIVEESANYVYLRCDSKRIEKGGEKIEEYSWRLKHLEVAPDCPISAAELLATVKEALLVHGFRGASFRGHEMPKFTTKFDF